jgi:hypothetical protein
MLYALQQGRYPLLLAVLPSCMQPSSYNAGDITAVLFFYQLAGTVAPRGCDKLVSRAISMMGKMSKMQYSPFTTGTCLMVGMKGGDKLVWDVLSPLTMLAVLLLVVVCRMLYVRYFDDDNEADSHSRRGGDGARGRSRGSLLNSTLTDDSTKFSLLTDFAGDDESDDGAGAGAGAGRAGDDGADAGGAGAGAGATQRMDFDSDKEFFCVIRAVAYLLLLNFSGLTSSTLQLLHCTTVSGERVLFYSGDELCSFEWQWPIWLLLLLIIVIPAAPVLIWTLRQLPQSWWLAKWAHKRSFPHYLVAIAVRRVACEPFLGHCWHWNRYWRYSVS